MKRHRNRAEQSSNLELALWFSYNISAQPEWRAYMQEAAIRLIILDRRCRKLWRAVLILWLLLLGAGLGLLHCFGLLTPGFIG